MFSVTRFCVQPFLTGQLGLMPGEPQQFYSEGEALAFGRVIRRRVAGFAIYRVTGWPVQNLWDKPKLVFKAGDVVPDECWAA